MRGAVTRGLSTRSAAHRVEQAPVARRRVVLPEDRAARDVQVGRYFLQLSDRKVRQCLAALTDNDDAETTKAADAVLKWY